MALKINTPSNKTPPATPGPDYVVGSAVPLSGMLHGSGVTHLGSGHAHKIDAPKGPYAKIVPTPSPPDAAQVFSTVSAAANMAEVHCSAASCAAVVVTYEGGLNWLNKLFPNGSLFIATMPVIKGLLEKGMVKALPNSSLPVQIVVNPKQHCEVHLSDAETILKIDPGQQMVDPEVAYAMSQFGIVDEYLGIVPNSSATYVPPPPAPAPPQIDKDKINEYLALVSGGMSEAEAQGTVWPEKPTTLTEITAAGQGTEQTMFVKQVKAGAGEQVLTEEQAEIAEYVEIMELLKQYEPMQKRATELKEKFAGKATEHEPAQEVVFKGHNGETITFSAASNGKEITDMNGLLQALEKKVGAAALIATLKLSLTQVQKMMKPHEYEPFITSKVGPRKMKGYTAGA